MESFTDPSTENKNTPLGVASLALGKTTYIIVATLLVMLSM